MKIIFLHGKDSSAITWTDFITDLYASLSTREPDGDHQLIALDLPGHGKRVEEDNLDLIYATYESFGGKLEADINEALISSTTRFGIVGDGLGARAALVLLHTCSKMMQRVQWLLIEDIDCRVRPMRKLGDMYEPLWTGPNFSDLDACRSELMKRGLSDSWFESALSQGLIVVTDEQQKKLPSNSLRKCEGAAELRVTVGWSPRATRLAYALLLNEDMICIFKSLNLPIHLLHCGRAFCVRRTSLEKMVHTGIQFKETAFPEAEHSIHNSKRNQMIDYIIKM